MPRLGLCCLFVGEQVKFRSLRAVDVLPLAGTKRLAKISELCLHNSASLIAALETVKRLNIGAFRIVSQLFPLYTHPKLRYGIQDLPDAQQILANLSACRNFREENSIRLSFHPDPFILISAPREEIVANSIAELDYQAMLSELVGADVVNIHMGGVYGDKPAAIQRFIANFAKLPARVRNVLTLENDDISYTPSDLFPVCRELGIPLVYDVHHHRCNPDGFSIEKAGKLAIKTWLHSGKEPYVHVSSPKNGWNSSNPKPHADYIDMNDFPKSWMKLAVTIDIEAKAKELAVLKVKAALA